MTSDVRRPIDVYLDAVDMALLKSGATRGRRGGIVRDLEAHILEVLRERSGERDVTAEDVAAVLAGLDAPEAYRSGSADIALPAAPRSRRVLPSHVRWGGALLATGFLGLVIVVNSFGERIHHASEFLLLMIASTPVVLMLVMSGVLGFAGLRRIREQPLRYWGRFFAAVEMAGFPILLVCASPVLFFTLGFTALLIFAVSRVYDLRGAGVRFLESV